MELAKFSYDADFYSRIHRLSISIRNYNSVAEYTERNLERDDYSMEQFYADLQDLTERSIKITEGLMDLCNSLVHRPFFLRIGCRNIACSHCLKCYRRAVDDKGGVCLRHSKLVDLLTYPKVAAFLRKEYSASKVKEWKEKGEYDDKTLLPDFKTMCVGDFYSAKFDLGDKYRDLVRYNLARLRFCEDWKSR